MSDPTRLEAASYRAAAPGTLAALHLAVAARMEAIAAPFWTQPTKTAGTERAPTVVNGWLPPKTPDAEQFPFLIVRPRTGTDSEQGADQDATATVEVIVGTYLDADDGWFEVLKIIDAIRGELASAPVLAGTAFEHKGPLAWELPEHQPRPQWFGTVTTIWNIPRPRRVEQRNPQED